MFKVEKTLKITIDQAGVEKVIREAIEAEHPDVQVNEITFAGSRKLTNLEVKVDAEFKDSKKSEAEVGKSVTKAVAEKAAAQTIADSQQTNEPSSSAETDATDAPTATAEETSFEDDEMAAIDATLAEEEEALDADKNDAESVDTQVEASSDEPEVETAASEQKPQRKSLFKK